jgi:hypothetical protein
LIDGFLAGGCRSRALSEHAHDRLFIGNVLQLKKHLTSGIHYYEQQRNLLEYSVPSGGLYMQAR